MNVLVIDDDNECLEIIKHMLEQEGADVVTFTELPDVILYDPDMIILDLYMPNKSGIDVCLELKSKSNTKNIPIVILSGSEDIKDKIRCLEAGAIEYIEKPIAKDDLIKRIKKYVHIGQLFKSLNSMTEVSL